MATSISHWAWLKNHAVPGDRASRSSVGGVTPRISLRLTASDERKFAWGRLDRFDLVEGCWREAIVEDHRTPVADQVSFRIDYPEWLQTLPPRDRQVAQCLAEGHSTTDVARRFGISLARVSQLRRQLERSWWKFHGELAEQERRELLLAA